MKPGHGCRVHKTIRRIPMRRLIVPAFAALGVVSLLPVAYKKLFAKKAAKLEGAS